jgi:hypothetical protein
VSNTRSSEEKKMVEVDASRMFCMGKRVCLSGYKERKRAHPNIVLVHDRSHESSRIDLLEVGGRWSTLASALFFLAGLRS